MALSQETQSSNPLTKPTSTVDAGMPWLQSLESELGVSALGITGAEAQARLTKYGYNELPEEKSNALLKFFSYFWDRFPG